MSRPSALARRHDLLERLQNNRNALGLLFMLPAAVLLLLFLTYPLGLGTWLGFTDAKIGRAGEWIGLENYEFLWGDAVTRLALFNTLFYTVVASVIKFVLGLWLALLLNTHLPFKAFFRAVVLLPFIVPTALSAIAFWWIYDSQFSIISWALVKMGLIDQLHRLPRRAVERALLDDRRQHLARRAVRRDHAARRPADDLAVATTRPRRSTARRRWQQFRYVTLPLLTPIIAVVMTFSVLFTFTDFQLIYVLTRGGPLNATHLMATLSFQRAISGRRARRGRGDRDRDGAVPARGDPVQLLRPAAPRLAAGRDGQMSDAIEHAPDADRHAAAWATSSRCRGACVTVYLPLVVFLFVLLFPFYWMAITSFKPNEELLSREGNPFWVIAPDARALQEAALRHRRIRSGCGTRCWSRWSSTFFSLAASVLAAYAIERLRFRGSQAGRPGDLPRLPGAAVDPVHPARGDRLQARPVRHALGADPHLSDVPDPVLHLAADGLLPLDPVRARGVRADRRRDALADPGRRSSCRSRCRA